MTLLLQIFGSLIQRNLIALELSDRMPILVSMLNQEMDESKVIYTKQMGRITETSKASVDRNMPPVSGQLKWAQELKAKMSFSVKSFKDLNHPICYREGAKLVFKKYKEMMHLLAAYEEEIFQKWNVSISKKMTQSLSRSLVVRQDVGEKGTLRVNFSRDLMSVLKEVRHLKKEFPSKAFPEVAGELFKREHTFRNYVNSLDQTVTHYNRLKMNTKPVESLLIESEIADIDAQLERAEHALNWNSDGIWNYMENIRCVVTDLSLRVSKAQQNVQTIKTLMQQWKDRPLFRRNEDGRSEALLNVSEMAEKKRVRYEEVEKAGASITSLVRDCQKYFQGCY